MTSARRCSLSSKTRAVGLVRELTARQRQALAVAVYYGVTQFITGSMPSLEKRGLMARERRTDHGVSHVYWVPTEAGRALAAQHRADAAATAEKEPGRKPIGETITIEWRHSE
jgi:hypothetical protein